LPPLWRHSEWKHRTTSILRPLTVGPFVDQTLANRGPGERLLCVGTKDRETDCTAQDLILADPVDEFSDLGRRSTCSIDSADQAAHAGSGDITDRDAVLFHPRNDSNVCEA
jgi:hypothetical protein